LRQEFKESHPDGYPYSQFCQHYRRLKKSHKEPSMRIEHKGGERMHVDYAGLTIRVINAETMEIAKASVLVAVLPASNYIYAQAQLSEIQCNWINGHVRALEYFGGVVKILGQTPYKRGLPNRRIMRLWLT
jgi:transposase